MITKQSMPGLNSLTLSPNSGKGRPSLISHELIEELATAIAEIPFVKPACESVGIAYETLRQWIAKGDRDKLEGREDSLYSHLIDRLARARATTERTQARKLAESDDWRAAEAYLRRGFRERWGDEEQGTKTSVTINLPTEVAGVLLDALSVGSKHLPSVESAPAIDAQFSELEKPSDKGERS